MKDCFQQLNLLALSVLTDNSVTEDIDLYDREFQSGFVQIYNKEAIGGINHIDISLANLIQLVGVLLSLLASIANCSLTSPFSL